MRVYLAPLGLWLTLDAGSFESVEVNTKTHVVRVELSPATTYTSQARLRVEQPAKLDGIGVYHPRQQLKKEREAYVISLKTSATQIELIPGR
jgi:hypothetical protein